jgi:pectate lyase
MKHIGFRAALCAALMLAYAGGNAADTVDPARQSAPSDGWASQAGGTLGGASAISSQIYSVKNRKELLAAIANGGVNPKIITVNGIIDMTEGVP